MVLVTMERTKESVRDGRKDEWIERRREGGEEEENGKEGEEGEEGEEKAGEGGEGR